MARRPGEDRERSDTVRIGRVPVRTADIQAVVGVAVVLGVVAYAALPLGVALAGAFAVAAVLGVYRSLRKHEQRDFRQIEALFSLFSLLPAGTRIPRTRGWAASPDYALLVARHLREGRPRRVLECGSGVSTVVAGLTLRELGTGTLLTLEHDPEWAERTRGLVRDHDLEDVVEVRLAPLIEREVGGERTRWYDTDWLEEDDVFDAVIVDGPPDPPADRYPLVPLLGDHLAPGATLLIDDAGRESARDDLRRWSASVPGLEVERVRTEKGAAVVRWPGSP